MSIDLYIISIQNNIPQLYIYIGGSTLWEYLTESRILEKEIPSYQRIFQFSTSKLLEALEYQNVFIHNQEDVETYLKKHMQDKNHYFYIWRQ